MSHRISVRRLPPIGGARFAPLLVVATMVLLPHAAVAQQAPSRQPIGHYRWGTQVPTGAVGMTRLQQGGPVQGHFQPVRITAPRGAWISMAEQGAWTDGVEGAVDAGLLIGRAYRIKVSGLELHPDRDCYPTIEVIDRTYPPPGMERRFPIQIALTAEDMDLALRGMLVTRVVYLEDPLQAVPGRQQPGDQMWFDAGAGANPLEEADRLGRPVAIIRLGARVPDESRGTDWEFLYGCTPWRRLPPPAVPVETTPTPTPIQSTPIQPSSETPAAPATTAAPNSGRRSADRRVAAPQR